jgi:hypothetical protein
LALILAVASGQRYLDSVLIRVQAKRRDAHDDLVVTVLNERGGCEELRLGPEDAERVERAWAMNQFDLDRYAGLPVDFPTPDAIPVEVSEAAAARLAAPTSN